MAMSGDQDSRSSEAAATVAPSSWWRDIREFLFVCLLVIGVFLAATSLTNVRGTVIGVAEVRDQGMNSLRFAKDDAASIARSVPFWTDDTSRIRRLSEGDLTEESFVVLEGDIYFITSTAAGKRLHRTQVGAGSSDVLFEADEGDFVVSIDTESASVFVSASDFERSTCFRIKADRRTRVGKGTCSLTSAGELLIFDRQDEMDQLRWLSTDLAELEQVGLLRSRRTLERVSDDGALIHALDSNGDPIFLSREGRIVWSRSAESLSVRRLAQSADGGTVVMATDLGREASRVDVISTSGGSARVAAIDSGEGLSVILAGDGSSMLYRLQDYLGEAVSPWRLRSTDGVAPLDLTVYRGSISEASLLLGEYALAWDDEVGVLLAGSPVEGFADVYDAPSRPAVFPAPGGALIHVGDEVLRFDPEGRRVERLQQDVASITRVVDGPPFVVLYRSSFGEDVLVVVGADGSWNELHRDDAIVDVQVIDDAVWFTAERTASSQLRVFQLPLAGSMGPQLVFEDGVMLADSAAVSSPQPTTSARSFAVFVDEERRNCLEEGLTVLEEGGARTFVSVPTDGVEFCIHVPRTREGDPVDLDVFTESEFDLRLELIDRGAILASVDDLLDASGSVVDLDPWILGRSFEQLTVRARVYPYDGEPVQGSVKVRVTASGSERPSGDLVVADYLDEEVPADCQLVLASDTSETVSLSRGDNEFCVERTRRAATFVTIFKDVSPESASATLTVDCGFGARTQSGLSSLSLEVSAGKANQRCEITSSDPVEIEILLASDEDAASARSPLSIVNTAPCDAGYETDDVVPIGRCSRGITVLTAQRALAQRGYGLEADGFHGPESLSAFADFQLDNGLFPDGGVSEDTWFALFPSHDRVTRCIGQPSYVGNSYVEWSVYFSDQIDRQVVACIPPGFSVTGPSVITFLGDPYSDTTMTLLDADLRQIDFDDDSGGSLDPELFFSIPSDVTTYVVIDEFRRGNATWGYLVIDRA